MKHKGYTCKEGERIVLIEGQEPVLRACGRRDGRWTGRPHGWSTGREEDKDEVGPGD